MGMIAARDPTEKEKTLKDRLQQIWENKPKDPELIDLGDDIPFIVDFREKEIDDPDMELGEGEQEMIMNRFDDDEEWSI